MREAMADPAVRGPLEAVYAEEMLPVLRAAGEADGIDATVATTLDRFANPFLDHPLAAIAQGHAETLRQRIGRFLAFAEANGDTGPKPLLRAALG